VEIVSGSSGVLVVGQSKFCKSNKHFSGIKCLNFSIFFWRLVSIKFLLT
jgi:hypothetical protein